MIVDNRKNKDQVREHLVNATTCRLKSGWPKEYQDKKK